MTMVKLFDISKEVFSATVYPGDPVTGHTPVLEIEKGAPCNLTQLTLGSHSATHMDAPKHFIPGGKSIDQVDLNRCIGPCQVVEAKGLLDAAWAEAQLAAGIQRLLVKGEVELSLEAAQKLAAGGLLLLGVEGMTVGTQQTGADVHRTLLGAEVAILESCDMSAVAPGAYILLAQPLKYGGLDGAQVRPVLVQES